MKKENKLRILGISGQYNAVSWYRILNPVGEYGGDLTFKFVDGDNSLGIIHTVGLKEAIKEHGDNYFQAYDVVVCKYVATPEDVASILKWRENAPNTKVFLDIDDNVFEIPETSSAHVYWGEDQQALFAYAAHEVDGLICSTQHLADYFSALNDNIYVIPNKINPEQWKQKRKSGPVKIGWTYSSTHMPDIEAIGTALTQIKEKYPDVVIQGTNLYMDGVEPLEGCRFKDLPKYLCDLKWDIAIGPLMDNEFNKGKSNIKWLESTMSGSVFVCSPVKPYSDTIEDGKTGFFATSEKEWVEILSKLIEDKKLRQKVQRNAKKVVMEKYNIKTDNPIKVLERGTQGQ